jgi:WD repeat-containing protein 55
MSAVPDEISCGDQIFDISFHPAANVFAAGLIDGSVEVWQYNNSNGSNDSTNKLMMKGKPHVQSCRGVTFNETGDTLYTVSSDRSLQGLDATGAVKFNNPYAHDDPINKMTLLDNNTIATGDDTGVVKLWDTRVGDKDIMNWKLHEDFVSGFAHNEEKKILLSVAGDATLCAYDLRKQANSFRSDDQESEIHCVGKL